jgi:hypothetical protein
MSEVFIFIIIIIIISPLQSTAGHKLLQILAISFDLRLLASTSASRPALCVLPDHLVSDLIPQRNPEHSSFHSSLSDLELVEQPCRERPSLGSDYKGFRDYN